MLIKLLVENYALIDRLEMKLDESLNIITGETGAGKSILLGALGLLMGSKNDGSATKDNTKSCIIEGLFSISELNLEALFEEHDWEYEEQVTIRRVITASGKSRAFIGDIPVSLGELKELTTRLIDIHSQHQNQILSDETFRINAVDLLYDSTELQQSYQTEHHKLQDLRSQLRRVEEIAASSRRDEEWLTHQVAELKAAKLHEGESEEAEAELNILENAEAINETLTSFNAAVDGDDDRAILITLRGAERDMQAIAKSFPAATEYAERLGSVIAELKDLNSSIMSDAERVESDPTRLVELSNRIDTLYSLCQKHRATDIKELIEIRDRYAEQLLTILNSDEEIERLRRAIEQSEAEVWGVAHKISKARCGVASNFGKAICSTLQRLGMDQARFEVSINPTKELRERGCDQITFLFSSVGGKSLQSVDRIASGGEISRVMLAIKALLAQHMELPTIIFDEIDTGVSGRIADVMGEIIEELSQRMQVVDITHLPQVASKGNSHFVVYKEAGRTKVSKLTPEERVRQIAMMISGERITEAALEQARILIDPQSTSRG